MEKVISAFVEGAMSLHENVFERHGQKIAIDYGNLEDLLETADENDLVSFFKTVGAVFARRIPDAKFAPEETVKKWVAEKGGVYTAQDLVKYRIGARAGRVSRVVDYIEKAARLILAKRKDVQERLKLEAGNGGISLKELFDTPAFEKWLDEKARINPAVVKLAEELEAQDRAKKAAGEAEGL